MQIFASKLLDFLKGHDHNLTQRVFLIYGDEPVQTLDSIKHIKTTFKKRNFLESEIIDLNLDTSATFDDFIHATNNLSLFSSKKIIELRLKGKLNKSEQNFLNDFIPNIPEDLILIINANKLTKKEQQSKWFLLCDQHGWIINASNISLKFLPSWIKSKLKELNLKAETDAINMLSFYFEGNLIACNEALIKLKIYFGNEENNKEININDIKKYIDDNARFKNFDLIEPLLLNNIKRCFHILNSLKEQKYDPILILWAITNEIRTLLKIGLEMQKIADLPTKPDLLEEKLYKELFNKYGIWNVRVPSIKTALSRLSLEKLEEILQKAQIVDTMLKGIFSENPWNILKALCLSFQGNESSGSILNQSEKFYMQN